MKILQKTSFSKYIISILATIALTFVWVQAWNGLTASSGDTLDAAKWNQLVASVQSGIPTGAIMSFNLASCPSGWTAYSPAVGRTVIGVGAGAGSSTALGDTGGEKSGPNITATTTLAASTTVGGGFIPTSGAILGGTPTGPSANAAAIYLPSGTATQVLLGGISTTLTGTGTATDNMQPYVALLYCQKD